MHWRVRGCQFFAGTLLAVAPLAAQSTSSVLLGAVKDPSGGVIAGALVTVRNIDQNLAVKRLSGPQGLYELDDLPPGRYTIGVQREGFQTATVPEFVLQSRTTRRIDFSLAVSAHSDSVLVASAAPSLDSEDVAVTDSKTLDQALRLPINSRALGLGLYPLAVTAPGVQPDSRGNMSVGGGLPAQVEWSVDGISSIDIRSHTPNFNASPSPEILSEFRVTSVSGDAGSGSFADVSIVTRAGGNQPHGSLFWYHQNAALDANSYGSTLSKQHKVDNSFGASFGGPVELPHLYNGRNRTFFFGDYEGNRQPLTKLFQFLVPTAAMRQGDLTNLPGGPALDPSTNTPFPGNRIPSTSLNPVAARLLTGSYPLPNILNASPAFNYQTLAPQSSSNDTYDLRFDHLLDSNQRVFLRWSHGSQSSLCGGCWWTLPSSRTLDSNRGLVAAHTFTSRNVSNELRFGFTVLDSSESFPLNGKTSVAALGLTGLNLEGVGDSGGFPWFNFGDATGFSPVGKGRDQDSQSRSYQVTDAFHWNLSRHSVQIGADLRRIGFRATIPSVNGSDDFGGFDFYSQYFSGNAFADLLLGLPSVSYYNVMGPRVNAFSTNAGFYVQDRWRAARTLTLEFGLRWELHPPMIEAAGNLSNFDRTTGAVIVPDKTIAPAPGFLASINACPNTSPCTPVLTASQIGLPPSLRYTYYGDWDPRFGFAWQPAHGKTVVRGGIGKYTQPLLGPVTYYPTGIHASDQRTIWNDFGADGRPLITLPNVLPQANQLGAITIGTAYLNAAVDPRLKDPQSIQWNLAVERELPAHMSVRAAYIGTQSYGMPLVADFNQVAAGVAPPKNRHPFPLWGYLMSVENLGFANYQGLQLEWQRRFRSDFFLQASYVYSKNLGEGGLARQPDNRQFIPEIGTVPVTDRFNTRYDRGNEPGSRRKRFLLSGMYPLPFGKGRPFASNWAGIRQAVLGGWELSTVTVVQSGPFLTPFVAAGMDRSNTDTKGRFVSPRPDRVGDGNLADPTRSHYFDISAFAYVPAGAGRFGNAGAGILQGPGTVAIAAGLAKTFMLSDKLRLRLESSFTNLPNHPNFEPPTISISAADFGVLKTQQSGAAGYRTGQVALRLDF